MRVNSTTATNPTLTGWYAPFRCPYCDPPRCPCCGRPYWTGPHWSYIPTDTYCCNIAGCEGSK